MRPSLMLAALAALQGGQTVEKKNPPFEEMVRMRIVYAVPGMDAVSVRRDVPYKTGDDAPLHMDVYSPPGPPRARPAVILVHGGRVRPYFTSSTQISGGHRKRICGAMPRSIPTPRETWSGMPW